MKSYLFAVVVTAMTVATLPLAADVGVSLSIGQPGFYGRLDIGGYPQPQVIYGQPMVIGRVPMDRPPIYLRVPPGHAKHWSKHCREYNACGERVLFVQDNWYNRQYVPHYQAQHRERGNEERDERRDDRGGAHGNNSHGDDHGHGHQK